MGTSSGVGGMVLRREGGPEAAPGAAARSLVRDPVLVGIGAFALAEALWYLSGLGPDGLRLRLLWPLQALTEAVFCVLSWRVTRLARPGPRRRFWLVMSASGFTLALGDTIQAILVLPDPTSSSINGGPVQSTCFVSGVALLVGNVLLYPTPVESRRERVRYWLDSATVLVAGAVLAWSFAADPSTASGDLVTTAIAAGLMLVGAFTVVKTLLSGATPITRRAVAPMIIGALVQGLVMFVTPADPAEVGRPWVLALRALPSVIIAFAPRIYELQARADPTIFEPHPPRPFSLLPYAAVGLTFVVLLSVLPGRLGMRIWGVVAGVGVITAVVVARQLLAFQDNLGLIKRLDATLLELRRHEKRLRDQASHDDLTRLYNRSGFVNAGAAALESDRVPRCLALLLVGLDDFRTVNDTLGHAVGDALLVTIAQRLRRTVGADDIVARLNGDEFAVLMRGAPGHRPTGGRDGDGREGGDVGDDGGAALAERVLAELSRPVRVGDHTLAVRASVGIAPADTGDDLHDLLRNADIAMYAAKDRGKSNCLRYTPDMRAQVLQTAELGAWLRDAIDTDQFHVVYQPIVRLDGGGIVGVEALVRWQHPTRGPMSPAEFIPVAERTGLIVPLGRWIMRQACRHAAGWLAEHPSAASVVLNVNVAGRQLREPGFVDEVAAVLADTGLSPGQLTIEVTETAVLQAGETMDALHGLRQLGVGLALDDFGTAASSLGLLLTCPVSSLKLDRSFVNGVTGAARQSAVATAVIQIARALDLGAVAEGIETVDQAEFLQGLGYRVAQGFLYSRPVPAEELSAHWFAALDANQPDRPPRRYATTAPPGTA